MRDLYDHSRSVRLLITAGVALVWLGLVLLAAVLSSAGREDLPAVLGVFTGMAAFVVPWVFLLPHGDDPPRHLLWSTIAAASVSMIGTFFLADAVTQTTGRDVPAVVSDLRWCDGEDCLPLIRLARLPARTDLGWSAACDRRAPDRGQTITVRVDRLGLFAAREKSCRSGGRLLGVLSVLVAAGFLTYLTSVFRLADGFDE